MNDKEYITVQKFDTEEEWDKYQMSEADEINDIEVIKTDQDKECVVL